MLALPHISLMCRSKACELTIHMYVYSHNIYIYIYTVSIDTYEDTYISILVSLMKMGQLMYSGVDRHRYSIVRMLDVLFK